MNYLDGILVLVIIFGIRWGYQRGMITLIAGLAGKILTLVLVLMINRPVALWVGSQFGLLDWLSIKLIEHFPTAKAMAEADMGRVTVQKLPDVLDAMGLPPLLKFKLMEQAPELLANGSASVTAIIQELSYQIAFLIVQFVVFFVLLVLVSCLIWFLVTLVDRILAGTLVGSLNRLLGMGLSLSLVLALLMLVIGLTAPLVLAPASGKTSFLVTFVQSSYLYPRFLEAYGLLLGALLSY